MSDKGKKETKKQKDEKLRQELDKLEKQKVKYGKEIFEIGEIVKNLKEKLIQKRVENEKYFYNTNIKIREIAEVAMEKTFEKKEIEDFRQKQLLVLILKIYMKYLPEIQTELQVCPESIKSANIREFCRIRINLEDTYGHYIAENIANSIRYTDVNENIVYSFCAQAENSIFKECLYRWEKCVNDYAQKIDSKEFYDKIPLLLCNKTVGAIDSAMKSALQEILMKLFGSYKKTLRLRIDDQIKIMEKRLNGSYEDEIEESREIIENRLGEANKEVETTIKNMVDSMAEFMFVFLKKKIFPMEEIWEYYYCEEMDIKNRLRQRLFDQMLQDQKGEFEESIEYKGYKLPKKPGEDIIVYNHKLNEFMDVVGILSEEFLGESYKTALQRDWLVTQQRNHDDLKLCITGIFAQQTAVILDKTVSSLWKEIFYIILINHELPNKKRKKLKKNNEKGYVTIDCDGSIERVWGISENMTTSLVDTGLKKNFSASFLMKITGDTNYKNLINKGYCKDRKIKSLVDNSLGMQKGLNTFEQYVVELQTGIISAWKIYECTSDLLQCAEWKMFIPIIKKLANAIGCIHNLEMKCWAIDQVTYIMNRLGRDYEKGMYSEMLLLSEMIDHFAKWFNEKYDVMFKILLLMFWDEEYFEGGQKDVNEDTYTMLLEQINNLYKAQQNAGDVRGGINTNPIVKNKFANLYYADAKTKWYKWYHIIWSEINQRQGWVFMPTQKNE